MTSIVAIKLSMDSMDSVFKLIGRLILGVLRPDSVEAKNFHRNEPKMRAYAVLLVELALADHAFDKREYAFLFSFFEHEFNLTPEQIRQLIGGATALITNLCPVEQFARYLRDTEAYTEREKLFTTAKALVHTDFAAAGIEEYLLDRLKVILGLAPDATLQ